MAHMPDSLTKLTSNFPQLVIKGIWLMVFSQLSAQFKGILSESCYKGRNYFCNYYRITNVKDKVQPTMEKVDISKSVES